MIQEWLQSSQEPSQDLTNPPSVEFDYVEFILKSSDTNLKPTRTPWAMYSLLQSMKLPWDLMGSSMATSSSQCSLLMS